MLLTHQSVHTAPPDPQAYRLTAPAASASPGSANPSSPAGWLRRTGVNQSRVFGVQHPRHTLPSPHYTLTGRTHAMLVASVNLPPPAAAFAEREDLGTYLPLAEGLVRRHFPAARNLQWELRHSYEPVEDYLALAWDAGVDLQGAMQAYRGLADDWNLRAPWPQLGLIQFDFDADPADIANGPA